MTDTPTPPVELAVTAPSFQRTQGVAEQTRSVPDLKSEILKSEIAIACRENRPHLSDATATFKLKSTFRRFKLDTENADDTDLKGISKDSLPDSRCSCSEI